MPATKNTDRVAVAMSAACIIHCLALPAIAVALPLAGVLAENEVVHLVFAILAVAASGSVLLRSAEARTLRFVIPAGIGIALIVGALFSEILGFNETVPTVIGGVFLAGAHLFRLSDHAKAPITG